MCFCLVVVHCDSLKHAEYQVDCDLKVFIRSFCSVPLLIIRMRFKFSINCMLGYRYFICAQWMVFFLLILIEIILHTTILIHVRFFLSVCLFTRVCECVCAFDIDFNFSIQFCWQDFAFDSNCFSRTIFSCQMKWKPSFAYNNNNKKGRFSVVPILCLSFYCWSFFIRTLSYRFVPCGDYENAFCWKLWRIDSLSLT